MTVQPFLQPNDELGNFFIEYHSVIGTLIEELKIPKLEVYEILWKRCMETTNINSFTHLVSNENLDENLVRITERMLQNETELLSQLSFNHNSLINIKSELKVINFVSKLLFLIEICLNLGFSGTKFAKPRI